MVNGTDVLVEVPIQGIINDQKRTEPNDQEIKNGQYGILPTL